MSNVKKAAAGLALAAAVVMYFEGNRPAPYLDPIGIPTVCYGHTGKDVAIGQPSRTASECRALLNRDMQRAWDACARVAPAAAVNVLAACTSFTFNVGARAMERSTFAAHLRAGRIHDACNELLRWNMAGRKVLPGLVKRREAERNLCLGE